MSLSNRDVAHIFQAIADGMEILGEDRFRILAYRRASDAIGDPPLPLADYRARHALEDIPGIGKTITEKIGVWLDTGTLSLYERLKSRIQRECWICCACQRLALVPRSGSLTNLGLPVWTICG